MKGSRKSENSRLHSAAAAFKKMGCISENTSLKKVKSLTEQEIDLLKEITLYRQQFNTDNMSLEKTLFNDFITSVMTCYLNYTPSKSNAQRKKNLLGILTAVKEACMNFYYANTIQEKQSIHENLAGTLTTIRDTDIDKKSMMFRLFKQKGKLSTKISEVLDLNNKPANQ